MVTDRGLQVLRAIVQDFVDTREPVGSKAIVERHAFGVSAATIRNDMALLEDEDLIAAPHTSSGRVPTDKGYRVFVDHLAEVRPLSPAQRTAISTFLDGPADLDDVLVRTVRALTQLTGQVAIVQYPSFARATVSHVELVQLGGGRMLVILVTDTGRVSQRLAFVRDELVDDDLARVRAEVASLLVGKPVREGASASRSASPSEPTARDTAERRDDGCRARRGRRARGVPPRPSRHGRGREPGAQRIGLPRQHLPTPGGDRGAGDAHEAHERDGGRRPRARREHRTRERAVRAGRGIGRRQRVRHDRRARPRGRARPDAHGLPDELRGGPCRRALPHTDARRRRECPLTRHL